MKTSSNAGPANIAVLGATGSVGERALAVIRECPDRFRLRMLTAQQNVAGMRALCQQWQPDCVFLANPNANRQLSSILLSDGLSTRVISNQALLRQTLQSSLIDTVIAAISGSAGLTSTLAAITAGKNVCLANKEVLVMAGSWLMALVKKHGATVIPIDSEHNGLWQCLPWNDKSLSRCYHADIDRVVLTASGGPFLSRDLNTFDSIDVEEACAHPNWKMGKKISIDSATMMNKVLEIVEAHYLFSIPPERIAVVIHPQSVVHAMVHYCDGSVLMQCSQPDMRIPIAYALGQLHGRLSLPRSELNFNTGQSLQFSAVDHRRFPALSLAYQALARQGSAPLSLSVINEEVVQAFIAGQISFDQIVPTITQLFNQATDKVVTDYSHIVALEKAIRQRCQAFFNRPLT